jgi:hypothetical protein
MTAASRRRLARIFARTLRGAAVAAPLAVPLGAATLLGGCTCPTYKIVKRVDPATYTALRNAGNLSYEDCRRACGEVGADGEPTGESLRVGACEPALLDGDAPAVVCTVTTPCGAGRRPAGLVAASASDTSGASDRLSASGAWWAQVARLEAGSIVAFAALEAELGAHGAPRALCDAARRAAADEVRHAALAGALARSRGVAPLPAVIDLSEIRTLEEIARDNAVEGCVRETYGAACAAWQAADPRADPDCRAALAHIAADERRHAILAWDVHDWLGGALSPRAQRRVADARVEAARALTDEVTAEAEAREARWLSESCVLGLPGPAHARRIAAAVAAEAAA